MKIVLKIVIRLDHKARTDCINSDLHRKMLATIKQEPSRR